MKISKVVTFEAAHSLPFFIGVHGHSFRATVVFEGNPGPDGTLADFGAIERTIKGRYDHKHLNEVMAVPPTLENIARDIGELLGCDRVTVERPTLGETAEWTSFGVPR